MTYEYGVWYPQDGPLDADNIYLLGLSESEARSWMGVVRGGEKEGQDFFVVRRFVGHWEIPTRS